MRQSPTASRSRLGRELRKLRKQARMTGVQAAKHTGLVQSQITHLELGQVKAPKDDDIRKLLAVYGATDPTTLERCLSWAEAAAVPGWWQKKEYAGLSEDHKRFLSFEHQAAAIRVFGLVAIPELLQTPDYLAALTRARVPNATDDLIKQRLSILEERRANLLAGDDPLERLWVIIHEAAILGPVGGRDVMLEQLEYLKKFSALLPNKITLQIAPGTRPHAAGWPLTLITLKDPLGPEVGWVGGGIAESYVEHQGEKLRLVFERLIESSLSAPESLRVVDETQALLTRMPAEIGTSDYSRPWIDLV